MIKTYWVTGSTGVTSDLKFWCRSEVQPVWGVGWGRVGKMKATCFAVFKGKPILGEDVEFFFLINYFWLCWVFVSVRGLSLVAASRGHSSLRCAGLYHSLLLWSTGFRRAGSVVAHRLSCSVACGIFPDQGLNLCPLH